MSDAFLADATTRTDPFLHFVSSAAFPREMAADAYEWLVNDADWYLHEGGFFEQYECKLSAASSLPATVAPLLDDGGAAEVRARVGALLGVDLTERTDVSAHRLVTGQQIGIHNDMLDADSETHRLVWHLGERRSDVDVAGGELLLFGGADPSELRRAFRPVHNSAVGFAITKDSHHAVAPVRGGDRYTIVFSFWADRTGSRDSHPLASMVSELDRRGAGRLEHTTRTLMAHLAGTAEILRRWGCPRRVCVAGLFHSVYGTESLREALWTMEERAALAALIGPEAEALVHLFCTTERRSLFDAASSPMPVLERLVDGSAVPVTHDTVADLLCIDAANELEQLPYCPLDQAAMLRRAQHYASVAPGLPAIGMDDLRRAFPIPPASLR